MKNKLPLEITNNRVINIDPLPKGAVNYIDVCTYASNAGPLYMLPGAKYAGAQAEVYETFSRLKKLHSTEVKRWINPVFGQEMVNIAKKDYTQAIN